MLEHEVRWEFVKQLKASKNYVTMTAKGKPSLIFVEVVESEVLRPLYLTLDTIFEWLSCIQPQATQVSPAGQEKWRQEIRLVKTSLNSMMRRSIFPRGNKFRIFSP